MTVASRHNIFWLASFPLRYNSITLSILVPQGNSPVERTFNTAGPIAPLKHYHVPPLSRLDWDEIQYLIQNEKYFVLHAPRQTGKTSTLHAMMDALNQSGDYVALHVNIESAQAVREDLERGIASVCTNLARRAKLILEDAALTHWLETTGAKLNGTDRLLAMLEYWSSNNDKPCVLFLDEVDALIGDTLISLLRQIRTGYEQRPGAFPQSIILCGVRDVRDYRIHSGGEIITGGSAFNIKSESLRMGNFSFEEMQSLLDQHTEQTGQSFEQSIFDEMWLDTKGQPWLVNALAHQMTRNDKSKRDRNGSNRA